MSTIGAAGFTAINLAGSLAGSQANAAGGNERAAEADRRRFSLDLGTMSAHSLDDVAETDLGADRDADGRRPWEFATPPDAEDDPAEDAGERRDTGAESAEILGRRLDVRA